MCFVHYELPEITLGNHNPVLKEQGVFLINAIALVLGSTFSNTMFHFLHHSITELGLTDLIFQGRSHLKICKKALRNNLEVELPECFTKLRLKRFEKETVAICLSSQGICNDIGLARCVFNAWIILLDHLNPTSLAKVQVWLCEDVLQALVIGEDVHISAQQKVSPRDQGMYHYC